MCSQWEHYVSNMSFPWCHIWGHMRSICLSWIMLVVAQVSMSSNFSPGYWVLFPLQLRNNLWGGRYFWWLQSELGCKILTFNSATPSTFGKDSDAGRDWGQEEKGTAEDEMAGWHHWLDGRESQWTPGVGDRQGGLACCDSWGCKESDTTEWLIWSDLIWF